MLVERFVDGSKYLASLGVCDQLSISVVLSINYLQQVAPKASLCVQVVSADFFVDWLLESGTLLLKTQL